MAREKRPKKVFNHKHSQLYCATWRLLRARPRDLTLDDLSQMTAIPVGWLKAFGQGRMADPSVVRVELLYNALAASPLEIIDDDI